MTKIKPPPEEYFDITKACQFEPRAEAEEILAEVLKDAKDGDTYTIKEMPNGRFVIYGPHGYL